MTPSEGEPKFSAWVPLAGGLEPIRTVHRRKQHRRRRCAHTQRLAPPHTHRTHRTPYTPPLHRTARTPVTSMLFRPLRVRLCHFNALLRLFVRLSVPFNSFSPFTPPHTLYAPSYHVPRAFSHTTTLHCSSGVCCYGLVLPLVTPRALRVARLRSHVYAPTHFTPVGWFPTGFPYRFPTFPQTFLPTVPTVVVALVERSPCGWLRGPHLTTLFFRFQSRYYIVGYGYVWPVYTPPHALPVSTFSSLFGRHAAFAFFSLHHTFTTFLGSPFHPRWGYI